MMDVVISQKRGWNMDIDNKPESFSQKENDFHGSDKISYPNNSNITVSECYKYKKIKYYKNIKFTNIIIFKFNFNFNFNF